ncbi:pentatricopeptide repeat-containing protein At2g40240, mitochondrial-like [Actinidia eriantha]|uniref:pentatricopeptide repeat-containing protein At2g40240, mitochondrial-like n=1 Tax=Actinidia eriantha TaxID=165200 RepID=UPI00258D1F72|nr:pentatricopeptide repeat-containing protein At2g40240, mitochondrial-like [Actinidia eriantha]
MQSIRRLPPKTPNPLFLSYISSRFLTSQRSKSLLYEPSSAYYDDLIAAAGRSGDFSAVHSLLNKRVRDGFFNTGKTFNFISTDLSVLDDLSKTLATLDRGFARKSAYDALVSRLARMHRPDAALRVAEDMLRGDHGANACTFHPIINALTRKKDMAGAWRVLDLMRENRISPDLTAYNYLLTAYCFAGDLTTASGLLTRMEEEWGMRADARTYDALVLGACRVGKVEGALVLLRRMMDDGVPALYSTHAHVISGLLRLGYYAQAVEFVVSYSERDLGLDTESFGLLASRLIKLNRFDEAKMVLKEMSKRGLKMGCNLRDFYDLHIQE